MKIHRLETQLWLPRPRQQVFAFFAEPRNLERLTPAWLHFEFMTSVEGEVRQGTLLDYRLRLHGIPLRWQSEIAVWEPPERFVDRQTKGPYSMWVHEHTFDERDGGTLVGDRVDYAVPGGRLVQKFFVAPDLQRIFRYRRHVLEGIFESDARATVSEDDRR
jgi:ligand-binding SRPBCC domain-containing protein